MYTSWIATKSCSAYCVHRYHCSEKKQNSHEQRLRSASEASVIRTAHVPTLVATMCLHVTGEAGLQHLAFSTLHKDKRATQEQRTRKYVCKPALAVWEISCTRNTWVQLRPSMYISSESLSCLRQVLHLFQVNFSLRRG